MNSKSPFTTPLLMNRPFKTARGSVNDLHWLDRNREVDFVLFAGEAVTAIEVKSGARKTMLPGIAAFASAFPVKRQLLVGVKGISLEEFLTQPAAYWLK